MCLLQPHQIRSSRDNNNNHPLQFLLVRVYSMKTPRRRTMLPLHPPYKLHRRDRRTRSYCTSTHVCTKNCERSSPRCHKQWHSTASVYELSRRTCSRAFRQSGTRWAGSRPCVTSAGASRPACATPSRVPNAGSQSSSAKAILPSTSSCARRPSCTISTYHHHRHFDPTLRDDHDLKTYPPPQTRRPCSRR